MPGTRLRASFWCGVAVVALLGGCTGLRGIAPASRPAVGKTAPAAPVLSPDVGTDEAERLSRATRARIEATEELVRTLDGETLPRDQAETYSTIQSFLAKAREALERKDLQRAVTLADKARILADELAQSRR